MKIYSYIKRDFIKMGHELIKLDFEYNSLEPYMDEETVRTHYEKHHQNYVNKLNETLQNYPDLQEKSIEELLSNLYMLPKEIKQQIINHGGGVYNHNFFWKILKKDIKIPKEILKKIIEDFESYEKFKEEFTKSAMNLFGSGWTWLVLKENKLEIIQTKNQETVISNNLIPLLTIDLWEHSYYLKYKNKRAEYVENFFHIINWEKVNQLYLNKV